MSRERQGTSLRNWRTDRFPSYLGPATWLPTRPTLLKYPVCCSPERLRRHEQLTQKGASLTCLGTAMSSVPNAPRNEKTSTNRGGDPPGENLADSQGPSRTTFGTLTGSPGAEATQARTAKTKWRPWHKLSVLLKLSYPFFITMTVTFRFPSALSLQTLLLTLPSPQTTY